MNPCHRTSNHRLSMRRSTIHGLSRRRSSIPRPRSAAARLTPALAALAGLGLALALAAITAPPSALASPPTQDDPFAVVDACVAAEMDRLGTPGASIAVARDGAVVYTKGYGTRHRELGGSIDARTRFRIGSTTKMMTAAAVMTLVDAGEVDLHAPITDVLPDLELPAPWDAGAITAHHLLSHTSGMPDSFKLHRLELFDSVPLETWFGDYLPQTPMAAPPGAFWNYSNAGFSLAGYLVERVSGRSHGDYTAEHVWRPAGMTRTTFSTADVEADGNFAWGHDGERRLAPGDVPGAVLSPAGMAFSTPSDLVTWAMALSAGGGAVLSPESAAAMQTPHADTDWSPWEAYGYGIFVTSYRDRDDPGQLVTVLEHGGNTTGWGSELAWVPERGIAISILDNTAASLGDSLRCALREIAGVVPRPTGGLTTPPASWDPFTGTYAEMNQALWDATVRITRDGDRLLLHRLEAGTITPLVNLYHTTFAIDADEDGRPDSNAPTRRYTFGAARPDGRPVRWMHNRIQVAERVGQFPDAVAIEGASCASIPVTPEIDIPHLTVRAAGLVPPGPESLSGLPLTQDDPADPSTAGFSRDIVVLGEAVHLVARVDLQPGDDAGLYLVGDFDGDGRFAYPGELVDVGWEGSGYRVLTLTGRLPAGRYQLWVHGIEVRGRGRTFSLETRLVHGQQLRVASAPASASAGETLAVEVCAEGVAGLDGPMTGLVDFDYGSPPRRVRIPVKWEPGESPGVEPRPIYVPWVTR